jgi:hypothetical protein
LRERKHSRDHTKDQYRSNLDINMFRTIVGNLSRTASKDVIRVTEVLSEYYVVE